MRDFLAARRKQVVAALVLLVALAMFLLPAIGHAQITASSTQGIHQQVAVVAPADRGGGDRGGDNDGDRGGRHGGRGGGGNRGGGPGPHTAGLDG